MAPTFKLDNKRALDLKYVSPISESEQHKINNYVNDISLRPFDPRMFARVTGGWLLS